jgi:hypothetical protein
MIKALMKLGTEGMCLNIIKAIYDKSIANIILNGEKLKIFLLKLGMRKGCPLFPLLFNIALEFLARAVREEEEMKGIQIGKEVVRLITICRRNDLILKRPKKLHQKLLDTINSLSKVAVYKINSQKYVPFLYTNSEQIEK